MACLVHDHAVGQLLCQLAVAGKRRQIDHSAIGAGLGLRPDNYFDVACIGEHLGVDRERPRCEGVLHFATPFRRGAAPGAVP